MTLYKDFLKNTLNAHNAVKPEKISDFIEVLEKCYQNGNTVYTFGNGGSGASASHFCEDLGKGTLLNLNGHKRFKVLSLSDNLPYILAWANDHGYETIFEQQLRNFGQEGDVAIGISGSGNSENVIRAIKYANSIGMHTIGFTGYDGGELGKIVNHQIHVPSFNMGIVESVHVSIMHYVVIALKERLEVNSRR